MSHVHSMKHTCACLKDSFTVTVAVHHLPYWYAHTITLDEKYASGIRSIDIDSLIADAPSTSAWGNNVFNSSIDPLVGRRIISPENQDVFSRTGDTASIFLACLAALHTISLGEGTGSPRSLLLTDAQG